MLNDLDVCVDSINRLLVDRGKKELSKRRYRNIFTFPVKSYYELAGFDFKSESFDEVAVEFIDLYKEEVFGCKLFTAGKQVLSRFSQFGYKQYMISAMEHDFLIENVKHTDVIRYFTEISGIQDHLANGKATMAKEFCTRYEIDASDSVFIGDTLHDYEVAKVLGMPCVLVSSGHQSKERLLSSGCVVVDSLIDLLKIFENKS